MRKFAGYQVAGLVLFLLTACVPATVEVLDGAPPTVNPFVAVEQAQRTAEAAQNEADFYGRQLTATAEAPIVAITQTAAAFAMEQQFAQATQQSQMATETAAWTATAMSWTATPNATTTAVFANSYAESTKIANTIELNNLQVERARTTNTMRAMSAYVIGFLVCIMGLMFAIVWARKFAVNANPVDERGNPLPMFDVVDGTAWDIDRAPNGFVSTRRSFLKQLPAITAERQDEVTKRDQFVDLRTRAARLPKRLVDEQGMKFLPEPTAEEAQVERDFLLPSWELVNGWDGKRGLPYYTAKGLELIDIDQYPHLSAIGMTGMGKSRRFFRPLIACALAAGHKVVIIGKSADYWPFETHPNAKLLKVSKITEPEQAMKYAAILQAIVAEMNRRDDVLTQSRKSTWAHAGNYRTFIFLDELGNALRLMDKEYSNQSRIWVEGLVSEGRKAGFNIVLANQRATGMASILSQTGKAIFRVERDEEKAHKSLSGASELRDGYFLAKFGASKLAGAFEPTDEEITRFLVSRPVERLDDDDWIDGQVIEQKQVTAEREAGKLPVDEVRKVIDLLESGEATSAIVRQMWGVTGGGKFLRLNEQVKEIWKSMNNEGVTA